MKKAINKFFTKISTALMVTSMLITIPMQSARADSTSDLISTIISVYNNMLGVYADMMYQFDPQIDTYIADNQAIINSKLNDALTKAINEETLNSFAGIQAQTKKDLLLINIKAADDVDINYASTSMYGVADDLLKQAKDVEAQKNNALFNVEYLIGTDVYKDDTAKGNAQAFLVNVASMFPPPPVIRMGATFDVPIMNSNDPSQKSITVGQKTPLTTKDLNNLRNDLQKDPDYRNYKKTYRAAVAIRNMLLDNLQYSYQRRLPQTNGKSIEQMENEQVKGRLSSEYYQTMSTASTDAVTREILFVLGEISNQLNEARMQNERILIANSVNALNQMSTSTAGLNSNSQKVGQIIYCKVPANKDDSLCKTQGAAITGNVDQLTKQVTSTPSVPPTP